MRHPHTASRENIAQAAADILARLRDQGPRVHCITNAVAQNFTANVLLAVGCVPSMTLSSEEVGPFVAGAHGLLVNLGTFDGERRLATEIAIDTAAQHRVPWVLDPVFVDRAPLRAAFANDLITRGPKAMRLNHIEFSALAGKPPSHDAVMAYARARRTVIALSGDADFVTDGERNATIDNGHALMTRVTAMGCAGSALVAACLAVEQDAFRAATAALIAIGVAGERAAGTSAGPGSFSVAIIDALFALDAPTLIARARVS